jgi:hypothetical protein
MNMDGFAVLPDHGVRPGKCALLARALLLAWFLAGAPARAQQIEPRAYSNAPIGVNFLLAGYGYAEGAVAIDPSLPLENSDIRVHSGVLAYVRTLDLWGLSAKADAVLPFASLSGSAELLGQTYPREVSGFGDLGLRLSVNLLGAPPLPLKEFVSFRQHAIVGASLQVSVPTGQYDSGFAVNVGTNRWYVRPEVGLSWAAGPWTLELATAASFYGDNDDFLSGKTREQDPIYSVQGGVIYNFPRGLWAALNGTYYTGGSTTVNGVEGDDLQENTRLGITLAMPVSRKHSIKLFGSSGVSTRTGADYDMVSVSWQYRWGGGL